MSRVVVTHWVHEETLDFLRAAGHEVIAHQNSDTRPWSDLAGDLGDADAVMVFMPDRVDSEFLKAAPQLKIVAGALKGGDNLDVDACTARGVKVTVVPDLLSQPTAELALALLLGACRNLPAGDHRVRSGEFSGWTPRLYSRGLHGVSVGVIGHGRVGREFTRLLEPFNVTLRICDPANGTHGLDDTLENSDAVVVIAPLNGETRHMISRRALNLMKPGALLVNVGRGSVVDEEAVADSLAAGHLGFYAADVFEFEDLSLPDRPRSIPDRLLQDPQRTLFTPHLGSAVETVRAEISMSAARSIVDCLAGREPA